MNALARLVLLSDPSKVATLHPAHQHTIGRAPNNRLSMPTSEGVAPHHAVVRFSRSHGWLVCDWGSPQGTWLEGQRIRHCRPLSDGDQIQLGANGPVLVFQLTPQAPSPVPAPAAQPTDAGPAPGRSPAAAGASAHQAAPAPTGRASSTPGAGASRGSARPARPPLSFAGREIPLEQIRSAHVHSRARFPHSFSWWVLVSLAGLVLLPMPFLFWPLEIGALLAWLLLGSSKEHVLLLTLRDGMAHRHSFTNKITALSHRNGIRKAIGQSLEAR